MKIRLTIFLIWLTGTSCMAQVRIDTLHGLIRAFYLPEKDLMLRTYQDGISLTPVDQPDAVERRKIRGWKINHALGEAFLIGEDLITVDFASRSIYRIAGDSLQVRENLPHERMTINGRMIRHDSTVYMSGGYGLWSARQPLLNIHPSDHRWNPVVIGDGTASSGPIPPGLHETIFLSQGDHAYLIYGNMVDPIRPLEKPVNDQVWSFDFTTHRWKTLGALNREVFGTEPVAYWWIPVDDHTILFPTTKAILDLYAKENRVDLYHHTVFSFEVMYEDQNRFPAFFRKGNIYFHREIGNPVDSLVTDPRPVEFASIPLNRFFGKKIGTYSFHTGGVELSDLIPYIAAALALAGAVFGYRFTRRKLTSAVLTGSGIRYRGDLHQMEPLTLAVLEKLLHAPGPVSSNELLQIIRNPELKYAHNNRVKNEIIRELNLQLRSIFNSNEDLITSTASDQDKRFRWYRLDRSKFGG